jgi:hypothetical protein
MELYKCLMSVGAEISAAVMGFAFPQRVDA